MGSMQRLQTDGPLVVVWIGYVLSLHSHLALWDYYPRHILECSIHFLMRPGDEGPFHQKTRSQNKDRGPWPSSTPPTIQFLCANRLVSILCKPSIATWNFPVRPHQTSTDPLCGAWSCTFGELSQQI